MEIVLVEPRTVTARSVSAWNREGFTGVALVLDERQAADELKWAAQTIHSDKMDLYYWIEVGRNPLMASAHPEWMASLGMHDDWHKRFPAVALPQSGEVAKAFPWVPIHYRDAFEAHLARIDRLLGLAPGDFAGVFLNSLQGGPASCGCGNLQCRWAIDYRVPSTGRKLSGDDAAAQFVKRVRDRAGQRKVIPVWTTECEDQDLPADKRPGKTSTGLCGTVPCAQGLCPKEFAKQWSSLVSQHEGPAALLGLHRELERSRTAGMAGVQWIAHAVDSLQAIPEKDQKAGFPRGRLWIVVQGFDCPPEEELAARRIGRQTGAGAIVVARARIDQSYEPKNVPVPR